MTIGAQWGRFVFKEYESTPESLAIFRLLYATLALVVWVPRYTWVAQFPDSFFDPPPGLTYLFFSGFPPPWFFTLLDIAICVALVFLLAGRRVMSASIFLAGCLLVGNSWAYSFGKIDHDILLVLAPLFLALAHWDGRMPVRSWPLALFAVVIGLAMFTAAVPKVMTGWLETSSSAVFGHAVNNAIFNDRQTPAWQFAIRTFPPIAWELMDYSTVLLEGCFVLTVARRRTFRTACAVAALFHFGVAMLMRIMFLPNLVAYAAFVKWDGVMVRLGLMRPVRRLQQWLGRRSDLQLVTTAGALALIALTWRNPLGVLTTAVVPGGSVAVGVTWIAAVSAAVFLFSELRLVLSARRRRHALPTHH